MNCLEFRRLLAAEPASPDPGFAAHRGECARCAEAYAAAHAFERELARALAVPVPPDLAEQVLLRQTTASRHASARPRYPSWRIAAGVVLALGAAALGVQGWRAGRPLPELAVAHLSHEPYALAARADIAPARIAQAFHRAGATLSGRPLRADYLQNCRIGGRATVHLVVQRPEGPVTLLYVVADATRARTAFERRGLKGRTVPMPDGTLVLLASEDRSFDALEAEWVRAIAGAAELAHAAP